MSKIYQNDVGTSFRSTIKDEEDAIINIATATTLKMAFLRPDATVVEFDAELVTDGTDGKLEYVTEDGDLEQVGSWQVQPYVIISTTKVHGEIYKFKVYKNIRDN